MKILVVSRVSWRNEMNGGNVLTNVFEGFDAEFAMITCSGVEPNNKICKKYYQMTDSMMISNIIHHTKVGKVFEYSEYPTSHNRQESYSVAKNYVPGNLLRLFREIVWKIAKWDKQGIDDFVTGFKPDVIYAPCQSLFYMIRLVKYVAQITNVPVISYVSDDHYTNKQYSLSPIFWINHFLMRRSLREIFKLYSLCYTMTDEQKEQCERDFGTRMKILRKSGRFSDDDLKKEVNRPIRLVYAGNLLYNRSETLKQLAANIGLLNKNEVKMTLDIYTNTILKESDTTCFSDFPGVGLHGVVTMSELSNIYKRSDIALHVESFDRANRYKVRLSFSTKIVDCLDSGCAVMAICDKEQAGGAYLRRNDCAICVNNLDDLYPTLEYIINRPMSLIGLQHKAFEIGKKNHLESNIKKELYKDFLDIIEGR